MRFSRKGVSSLFPLLCSQSINPNLTKTAFQKICWNLYKTPTCWFDILKIEHPAWCDLGKKIVLVTNKWIIYLLKEPPRKSLAIFISHLEEHIDFVWVKPTLVDRGTKSRTNNICGEKDGKQKQKVLLGPLLLIMNFPVWKVCVEKARLGVGGNFFCGDKNNGRFFHQFYV